MTEEQINIAIAEACGWKYINNETYAPDGSFWWSKKAEFPDYYNDLNVMHEAEKILKLGLRNTYDAELGLLAERDYCFIWETTAVQRAEAFLKTLNKWEGTPIE